MQLSLKKFTEHSNNYNYKQLRSKNDIFKMNFSYLQLIFNWLLFKYFRKINLFHLKNQRMVVTLFHKVYVEVRFDITYWDLDFNFNVKL